MKSLLIFCFIQMTCNLLGQIYLDESSVWKGRNGYGGAGNPYFTVNDYTIRIEGDTMINGKFYYKTLMTGIRTTRNWVQDTIVQVVPIYEHLPPIREENQVIYRYKSSLEDEVVLHNFNLSIGDTATSNCENQVVFSIDTVFIGNVPRRQFHFSSPESETCTLIEGIGSTNGLYVQPCNGYILFEEFHELQCYSQNQEYITIDSSIDCNNLILSVDNSLNTDYNIYPNPFQNELQIDCLSSGNTIEITFINIMGSQVYYKSLTAYNRLARINTTSLPPGIYFILLKSNDSIASYKVIKGE